MAQLTCQNLCVGYDGKPVLKFCRNMGYHGFLAFRRQLQEYVRMRLSPNEKVRMSLARSTDLSPLVSDGAQSIALLIFSAIFFAFVLFFSLRPGKITVWIGKIINPIFLIFLAILVIAALIHPGASVASVAPTEAYATKTSAFFASFIEGYGTMDAIAGLAFGMPSRTHSHA